MLKMNGKNLVSGLLIIAALILFFFVYFFSYRDIPVDELKAVYAQPPSQFLAVDGMQVHYRDEGNLADSVPIVLIHGTGSSLHTFDDWTAALIQNHRVVRMDLPGFGLTGPFINQPYTLTANVDFIVHFLQAVGIEKCVLAGNSLGGQIAWHFSLQNPETVEKLILIDADGLPGKPINMPLAFRLASVPVLSKVLTFITPKFMARKSVENVYFDISKVSDSLVDRYFNLTLRTGNRQALIERMHMPLDTLSYHKLKSFKQPTLILWGAEDMLIPVENAERFHTLLPNSTLVVMPNVGHVPMEESPIESLAALTAFLKN